MKLTIIAFLLIALVGCGDTDSLTEGTVTLDGEAAVNVQDSFTTCQVRQNGTTLFVKQAGLDEYVFAFDNAVVSAVLYQDEWIDLDIADTLRTTPLTQVETDIINGDDE